MFSPDASHAAHQKFISPFVHILAGSEFIKCANISVVFIFFIFRRNTFFNSNNKINGSMEGVNVKRLAVIIKANLRFRDLEIGLWLANG